MKISKSTKRTLSLVSALSIVITSVSFPFVMADDKTESVVFPEATETITVSEGDSIQEALNKASDNTDSEYTKVVLSSGGKYHIDLPLRVYSNTVIQAEGALIERTYNNPNDKGTGLIRNVAKDGSLGLDSKTGKYDLTKNVYINGGTWSGGDMNDANIKSTTNIIFCHAENIFILNAAFQNNYNGHLLEVNAVKNCLIQNCSFDGLKKSNSTGSCMALQIDIAHSYSTCKRSDGEHIECPDHESIPEGYYPDDTACKDIRVLSNSWGTKETGFGDFDTACGSDKTLTDGAGPVNNPGAPVYHENINISYNTIKGCSSIAIASRGHKNATIKGNTITNCGDKGIIVKRSLGGTVTDNILTDIGNVGIFLFEKSTLPLNDPNRNTTQLDSISNNTITRAGYHGIAVQDESSVADIDGNTVTDVKGHGISASGSSKITSISKNTVNKSSQNGISIYESTNVNSITDNSVSDAETNGIIVNKNSSVTGKISGNTINNPSQNGISIYEDVNVGSITDNSVSDAKKSGIIVSKNSSVTGNISKNIVKNTSSQGIRLADGSKAGEIEQNTVSNSGENGISLWSNSSAASISQNTITDSKQNGIVLSTNCKTTGNIDGNTISNSGKNGIFIYSDSSSASIKNNKISYSTSHGISVGTNSEVSEISSNNISNCKGNGITINTKSKAGKISGNTFSNNTANCKVSKDSQVSQNDAVSTSKKPAQKPVQTKKPTVKKVKTLKVKSKKKKTVTVTWTKLSGVNGYRIEYSLKRNFKGAKTKMIKKNAKSCKIKKLKSKKKYFFRIKAYKNYTVSGARKTAYGAYSTVKNVKVK